MCRMEGRTYGSLSLIGPSGNVWTVQLLKQDNDLFFHHGWSSFVVDHSLECGDLLVFRYEGHLHFTVQVFDKDACEKEAAFISECSQSSSDFEGITGQKRGTKESSSLDIAFDGVSKKMRGCKYENQEHEPGFVGKELLRYEVVRPIRMFRETEETSKACLANDALVPFHTDNRNEGTSNLIKFWFSHKMKFWFIISLYLSRKTYFALKSLNICHIILFFNTCFFKFYM